MVFRYGSLLKNTTSGLQIPWVLHPRLGHFRPSADGETDTANARPSAFAAEAYLWTRKCTHRDTRPGFCPASAVPCSGDSHCNCEG